jgi:transcriptional regulator with GAF, ATPase, and Fis domain
MQNRNKDDSMVNGNPGKLIRFEYFLSEISAKYINLPAGEIETEIRKDLGRLAEFLDADRGVLYLFRADGSRKMDFPPFHAWPISDDDSIRQRLENILRRDPDIRRHMQVLFDQWAKGSSVQFSSTTELPSEWDKVRGFYDRVGIKSMLSVPLMAGGSVLGAILIATVLVHRSWPTDLVPRVRLFAEAFGNALLRKRSDEKLQAALTEITRLKEQIESDYRYLRYEGKSGRGIANIVGKSTALKAVVQKLLKVAPTHATVLFLGETGTGKGLFVRTLHDISLRKNRPLVQVNCAALSPGPIESELFAPEKGAFT